MLHGLSPAIKTYLKKAAAAHALADASLEPRLRRYNLPLAGSWSHLAQSQDFVEGLQRFTAEANRRSVAVPPTNGGQGNQGSNATDTALISIVDDDDNARRGLVDLIQSVGYVTADFPTAEQFLLSNIVRKTACLISDVQMPGMSGLDLLAKLIADGQPTPVIFVTGFPDERVRARALASGAVGFHAKPLEPDALIESIGKALASVA